MRLFRSFLPVVIFDSSLRTRFLGVGGETTPKDENRDQPPDIDEVGLVSKYIWGADTENGVQIDFPSKFGAFWKGRLFFSNMMCKLAMRRHGAKATECVPLRLETQNHDMVLNHSVTRTMSVEACFPRENPFQSAHLYLQGSLKVEPCTNSSSERIPCFHKFGSWALRLGRKVNKLLPWCRGRLLVSLDAEYGLCFVR